MEILILSKTHYGKNSVCVGGVVISSNKYVRLLNPGGWYQYADTEFNIGDIWDIEFKSSDNLREPHSEDVIISRKKFVRSTSNITQFILDLGLPIWRGNPDTLFNGLLQWTDSGSGYINEQGGLPEHSVGFWVSDHPIERHIIEGEKEDGSKYETIKYNYPQTNGWRNLPYKGVSKSIEIIPKGTMIRVSLAKWWDTNGKTEERCSLQLSGWYELSEPMTEENNENEDLSS